MRKLLTLLPVLALLGFVAIGTQPASAHLRDARHNTMHAQGMDHGDMMERHDMGRHRGWDNDRHDGWRRHCKTRTTWVWRHGRKVPRTVEVCRRGRRWM